MQKIQHMADALFSAVLHQDNYLAMHMCRVGVLCERIAEHLNDDSAKPEDAFVAGLMHDIGKIALPPTLLLKQGPLLRPEFELIKTHTQIGANILSKIEFPPHIVEAVLYHHERLDGKGYYKQREFSLLARIVTVADVFDALTAFRPYKQSFSKEDALKELVNFEVFDKEVVEALRVVLDGFGHEVQTVTEHTESCFRCAVQLCDGDS